MPPKTKNTRNKKSDSSLKPNSQKSKDITSDLNTPVKTPAKRGRKKKQEEPVDNEAAAAATAPASVPAKRGRKKKQKEPVDNEAAAATAPASVPAKRGQKEPLNNDGGGDKTQAPVYQVNDEDGDDKDGEGEDHDNEKGNDDDDNIDEGKDDADYDGENSDGDSENYDDENFNDDENPSAKRRSISINKLLEVSDDDLSEDDARGVTRRSLASITNNMNFNEIRNNDPNKATGSFFNNSHTLRSNESHYTTPRSSTPCLINTHLPTPTSRRPTISRTTHPSTPSARLSTSHFDTSLNDTSFNDDGFRRDDGGFRRPLNNNTSIPDTFDNVFRSSNDESFRLNDGSTPFHGMDNIHQVCLWLCKNPNVLLLAYNMYLSMNAPVANGFNFLSPNLNSPISATAAAPHIQEDKNMYNRDFLDELKCLFLRTRDPAKNVFEDLVRQIFKCSLNSAEGIDWLRSANKNFGDFRNKFLDIIVKYVDKIKKIRADEGIPHTTIPSTRNVVSLINETTTLNILNRWVTATNLTELREQNTIPHLRKLVVNAIIINYLERDTERTKTLDDITKNIAVPSRDGKNIASNLQL